MSTDLRPRLHWSMHCDFSEIADCMLWYEIVFARWYYCIQLTAITALSSVEILRVTWRQCSVYNGAICKDTESPQVRNQSQSATHPVLVMISKGTHIINHRLGGLYCVKININISKKSFNRLVQRIRTGLLSYISWKYQQTSYEVECLHFACQL